LLSLLLTVWVTASAWVPSTVRSSAAVIVTVCGVFQLPLVKTSGLVAAAICTPVVSATLTLAVGWLVRATV